jgi:hypothetical protein
LPFLQGQKRLGEKANKIHVEEQLAARDGNISLLFKIYYAWDILIGSALQITLCGKD